MDIVRSFFSRNAATIKMLGIGVLLLLLLIPAYMVETLIAEREERKDSVVQEIASKWGQGQTFVGPILAIPSKVSRKANEPSPIGDKSCMTPRKMVYVLPDLLDVSMKVEPHVRYRGLFEAVLYETVLQVRGRFSLRDLKNISIPQNTLLMNQAKVIMGISDIKGIKENIQFAIDGDPTTLNPGVIGCAISSGVSAKVPHARDLDGKEFSATIILKGNQDLQVTPVGMITTASMEAEWPTPSFNGAFLPEKRQVTDKGFTASWKVLHFNRIYPQAWVGERYRVEDSAFGVRLLIEPDIYRQSMRTAKYAVMFIGLTFMAFFFAEMMNRRPVHPIQYILVGITLLIFYTLLISLSEHVSFDAAYGLASAAVIGLIALYSASVLRSTRLAVLVGGVLTILYGYLYILLQLEDFALLMGSIGLFIVLAIVMYLTRKIDWYDIANLDPQKE